MKRAVWGFLLLGSFAGGCAGDHEARSLPQASHAETQATERSLDEDVLVFNESPTAVRAEEGVWQLRVSSFVPVQAIYVDGAGQSVGTASYDFQIAVPYHLQGEEATFEIAVYTTAGVVNRSITLRHL
jgi:hypothetical protein